MGECIYAGDSEYRAQTKIDKLTWAPDDANMIASFLKGEVHPAPSPNTSNLWGAIGEPITLGDDEARLLLLKTMYILDLNQRLLCQSTTGRTDHADDPDFKEYMYSSGKRAEVAASLVGTLLQKAGITEGPEQIRIKGYGGRRLKGKSSFSQGTKRGQELADQGYISTNEGGPHAVNAVTHRTTKT